jgi:hypothetical protein
MLVLYVCALLLIVPLAGLLVTGSWRGAWRYARDWSRVMALTVAIGLVVFFMLPTP